MKEEKQSKQFTSKRNGNSRKKVNRKEYHPSDDKGENFNDIAWYNKYPKLVEAASSLIFNTRYGSIINVDPNVVLPAGTVDTEHNSIPGVVKLEFRTLLARDGSNGDAINVASKNQYMYVRHANSGSANYESSDMMQYNISVLSIATYLEQLKRDLRLVGTFSPINRYVYRAILLSRGYTAAGIQDMIDNHANYTARVNLAIAKLNTFKIPRDFAIYDKLVWMVTNVFKDDSLDKATYYFYATRELAHYDWANRVVTYTERAVNVPFGTQIGYVEAEIQNLLDYEDIGIMIGDILKAYKQEGCRVWTPMSLGEIQDASYSEEVLTTIMNTIAFPSIGNIHIKQVNANTQDLALYQGSKTVANDITADVSTPNTASGRYVSGSLSPVIVMETDTPNNADVIIGTRNTNTMTFSASGANIIAKLQSQHTNVVVQSVQVTYFNGTSYNTAYVPTVEFFNGSDADDTADIIMFERLNHAVSKFPTCYYFLLDTNIYTPHIIMRGKNNQVVSATWLGNLHDGCTLSELSLPMFKLLESN